jgi:hypothetical protein
MFEINQSYLQCPGQLSGVLLEEFNLLGSAFGVN